MSEKPLLQQLVEMDLRLRVFAGALSNVQKEVDMDGVLRHFTNSTILGTVVQQAHIASSCGLAVLYNGVRGYLIRTKKKGRYDFSPEDSPSVRERVQNLSHLAFPEDDVIDGEEGLAA